MIHFGILSHLFSFKNNLEGFYVMKNYIKLFTKSVLVLTPLWAFILYAKFFMLDYVNAATVSILWNNEFTHTKQDKYYSVVILGDSTANGAYIPEVLSDSTINLALSGTGMVENYYTLANYLQYNDAPEDIFISFSDYHLEQDSFTWSELNRTHKLSLSQNLEIYQNINNYSSDKLIDVTGESDYWSNFLLYKTYMPSKYAYPILQGIYDPQRKDNLKVVENLNLRQGRYYSITNDIYSPDNVSGDEDFIVSPLQDRYSQMLLELCKENNIRLHFVKLPVPANFVYFDSYRTQITDYYYNLTNQYSGAEFVCPCERYESYLFADGSHLNNHGALTFSTELKTLYPNIFSDNILSENRLEALNLDIQNENDLYYLNLWARCPDYLSFWYLRNNNVYVVVKTKTGEIISHKSVFLNADGIYELHEID